MRLLLKTLNRVPSSAYLFCFLFSIYAVTVYGRVRYGDETERYLQAQSLVDRQSWAIRRIPSHEQPGVGGQNYSQFELGYGLLLIPPYILGRTVSSFIPYGEQDWIPTLFVSLVNPAVTAMAGVVLFWFSCALGVGRKTAVWVSLIFGLGTLAWPYTRGIYREATQTLTLLLSVYAVYMFRRTDARKWLWTGAISFGYLVFTKISNLALLPLFLFYLAVFLYLERTPVSPAPLIRLARVIKGVTLFLIPLFVLLGIQAGVNLIKYGNLLTIGPYNYSNPIPFFSLSNLPAGVFGLLVSQPKGLFIYAPPVILFFLAWFALFSRSRAEAVLILALVAVTVLYNASYAGWDGGSYWGPRYLVLIVPLMILPLGVLIESGSRGLRSLWVLVSVVFFLIGLSVQLVAALPGDREYSDVMGRWIDLPGAIDFLRHGAIDSLVLSASQSGQFTINPYGWLLLSLGLLVGLCITLVLSRPKDDNEYPQARLALLVIGMTLAISLGGLVRWVAAEYPTVLASQGNTRFFAANAYYSESRFCEAEAFYLTALYFGTSNSRQTLRRLELLSPRAAGTEVNVSDLRAAVMQPEAGTVEEDNTVSLVEGRSLKLSAPPGKESNLEVDSEFVSVRPNTRYELSGWMKTEGVHGSGYTVIGWYEDNGTWQRPRSMDIASTMETHGWQPFRQLITTLPTTRRVLLKSSLWHVYGTMWVDGIHLVEVDQTAEPDQVGPLCAK